MRTLYKREHIIIVSHSCTYLYVSPLQHLSAYFSFSQVRNIHPCEHAMSFFSFYHYYRSIDSSRLNSLMKYFGYSRENTKTHLTSKKSGQSYVAEGNEEKYCPQDTARVWPDSAVSTCVQFPRNKQHADLSLTSLPFTDSKFHHKTEYNIPFSRYFIRKKAS